jgi:hypothetical protein
MTESGGEDSYTTHSASQQYKPLPSSHTQLGRKSVSDSHKIPSSAFGVFSHILRRDKKAAQSFEDTPPPTPPKDSGRFSDDKPRSLDRSTVHAPVVSPRITPAYDVLEPAQPDSLSDFSVIAHSLDTNTTIMTRASNTQRQTLPFRSTTSAEIQLALDPAEKARRRIESERARVLEEKEALKAEAERQARLKREKQETLRREEEDAERRRIVLQEEVRQLTAERSKKGRDISEAEKQRSRELAEMKRIEKERRMEESKRLDMWRKEQARLADDLVKRKEHDRKRAEEERRRRIALAARNAKANESCATGWVTIQTNESLVWRRRFFKLVGTTIYLYRSPEVSLSSLIFTLQFFGMVFRT